LLLFILVLAACGNNTAPTEETAKTPATSQETTAVNTLTDAQKTEVITTYADIVFASYEDSYETAVSLQQALEAFVAEPSEATQQAAKEAWLAAREPYGQTEAYRFYGGPIDDEDGPEGLLNAWPLDESYIDYVDGIADSGIINNPVAYPEINAELLASLNEAGSEENISVGYHAIEFLLWGQDLSADSNGKRAYTDYTTAPNAERRGQYLLTAADLLVSNLDSLVEAWRPETSDNYRAEFLAKAPDEALQQMLTGMGVLSKSELPGERMFVAYDNQDHEDEHSCFSDNTHRDIAANAQGIYNVYNGTYTRVDGTKVSGASLADLVAALDKEMAAEMKNLADSALTSTTNIYVPFDQAIVVAEHRPAVLDSVNALQDQGDKVAEVASLFGLSVNTDLPE
jgi:putative iron-regulated protein